MPKIRRISIRNFRSIIELEMTATDLTIVVGDNDCGKSNVLRSLNLFFNGETNPGIPFNFGDDYNRFAEAKVKRAPEIEVILDLELPESYRKNNGDLIRWRKRWRADGLQDESEYWGIRRERRKRAQGFSEQVVEIEGRSRVPALLSRIRFEYVPAVRSAEFFRNLRGRIFAVIAAASEQTVRESSGKFEAVISNAVSGLLHDIGLELRDVSRLSLPNDLTPLFQSLDFLAGEKSISLDNRGDGIKARYIPLILKFIAERSRDTAGIAPTFIWAYEEPENNLEFRRAQALADAFHKLAEDELSQVILTTHSPVFYNMYQKESSRGLCSAFHLTKETPDSGTVARSAEEANVSLDESMGAMAIIAPHIKSAQEALAEAALQTDDLKAKLAQLNGNLPTLFVEGPTDHAIFSVLLNTFRPDKANQIFMPEPPKRAGANYVTNMLRSWEFRAKHLPPDQRKTAVGIVDGDDEGLGAKQRYEADLAKAKHAHIANLSTPPHLAAATACGISIPTTLEELWPAEIWDHAATQGWLAARSKKGLISEKLLERLTETNERLGDLIEDEWRIYFEKCADDSGKSAWANYMCGLPVEKLEPLASSHLEVLDAALEKLGV